MRFVSCTYVSGIVPKYPSEINEGIGTVSRFLRFVGEDICVAYWNGLLSSLCQIFGLKFVGIAVSRKHLFLDTKTDLTRTGFGFA